MSFINIYHLFINSSINIKFMTYFVYYESLTKLSSLLTNYNTTTNLSLL
jgi:hypothetical protein